MGWLRRNNKWIMVIAGIGLMVMFLVPQQMAERKARDVDFASFMVGTNTLNVTRDGIQAANQQLALLNRVGIGLLSGRLGMMSQDVPGGNPFGPISPPVEMVTYQMFLAGADPRDAANLRYALNNSLQSLDIEDDAVVLQKAKDDIV